MTVTSAPIGSTGQSLDGFAVDANVLQAFRESVVITDPSNSTGAAPVNSNTGLSVNVASSVPHTIAGTSQIFGTVSTQVVSSIPFYVAQSSAPWTVNGGVAVTNVPTVNVTNVPAVTIQGTSFVNVASSVPHALVGTSQIFGTVSSQIVSSIPLLVAQSTSPWVVSSAPIALVGTSQVFGTVSTQVVSSIPFFVAQSSSPWTFNGGVNVSTATAVQSTWPLSTTLVNVVSSIPVIVAQSTNPWTVNGSTFTLGTTMVNVVSSVTQNTNLTSSIPLLAIPTATSTGGGNSLVISFAATLNTTVVKAGAGVVYALTGCNIGSSNVFVRFYEASTAAATIASTGVPAINFGILASTTPQVSYPVGVNFSSGITIITQQQPYTATTSLAPTASTATISIVFQ